MKHIGTGEGEQAYGHGLYFAEDPKVAGTYKQATGTQSAFGNYAMTDDARTELQKISASYDKQGDWLSAGAIDELTTGDFEPSIIRKQLISNATDEGVDVNLTVKRFDDAVKKAESYQGHLYEVDIPDEQIAKMLDWDKPLSEQPQNVRDAIKKLGINAQDGHMSLNEYAYTYRLDPNSDSSKAMYEAYLSVPQKEVSDTGADIYKKIAGNQNGYVDASKRLNELGIPGIKYLDGDSRFRVGDTFVKEYDGRWQGGIFNKKAGTALNKKFDTKAEAEAWVKEQSAKAGTRNIVAFDDGMIKILKRNGQPVE